MTLKFIDFFAGVGGFRKGLEMAGHECVGFVEWDKFARQSYQAIFETEGEYTENDIRAVRANELPRANIWCFGFPCQDISIAGSQQGFDGERSSLFYGVTKLIRELKKEDKPELLFIENVKNLLSVNGGFDFLRLQVELDEIGYNLEWDVLNSKYFGVPQNRERAFIIGHLRGKHTRKVLPIQREGSVDFKRLEQIAIPVLTPDRINRRQSGRRFKNNGEEMFTLTAQDRHGVLVAGNLPGKHDQNSRVYNPLGISPTLTTMQGGGQEPKIVVSKKDFQIRKLTPLECWRLQGWEDEMFYRAKFGSKEIARRIISEGIDHYNCEFEQTMSDSQLYKQAGNGVTVTVIYEIAKRLSVKEVAK